MKDIFLAENYTLLKAEYSQTDMHKHSAQHMIVGIDSTIECQVGTGEKFSCPGVVIGTFVPHTIDSGGFPILVFLIDAKSDLSLELKRRILQSDDYYIIDQKQCHALYEAWKETNMSNCKDTI